MKPLSHLDWASVLQHFVSSSLQKKTIYLICLEQEQTDSIRLSSVTVVP